VKSGDGQQDATTPFFFFFLIIPWLDAKTLPPCELKNDALGFGARYVE